MTAVAGMRVRAANGAPENPRGEYVLYWMIAARRAGWNFALDRAVDQARRLGRPLVVLEPLRAGYRWANDRIHSFVLDGMAENERRFSKSGVLYFPYLEPEHGAGRGLLEALAARACVVVSDDSPAFFLPRMIAAAAARLPVRLEMVDSNGLLPLAASPRVFPTAYSFRRFLQRELPPHLGSYPRGDPLAHLRLPEPAALPAKLRRLWPPASVGPPVSAESRAASSAAARAVRRAAVQAALARIDIDHSVPPVAKRGGSAEAEAALRRFLRDGLARYAERDDPVSGASSGLSPYLHFGHVSAHRILAAIARRERWSPADLSWSADGSRTGWWRMSPESEAFLDQCVTWRELGFQFASKRADHDRFESLPEWARRTLRAHARDRREARYTPREFERAATHDPLWNAAQRQLLAEGTIHNYMRMLWGKKILEWSESPERALETMIHLNNKYALDGRDPNSSTGILWVMGRHDRPWGPERPVLGTVRPMSTASASRKLRTAGYLERYGA